MLPLRTSVVTTADLGDNYPIPLPRLRYHQQQCPPNSRERTRTDANVRGQDDRYVGQLEKENEFLRSQVERKDKTIEALLERDRETNVLIAGLQRMFSLSSPKQDEPKEHRNSSDQFAA